MYITQQQEQFSNAYLRAVATVAGYCLSKPEVDDDSIDFTLSGKTQSGVNKRPRLELQLKCLMQNQAVSSGGIHYPLKIKNYNDLRIIDINVPRILVVVVVPDDINKWLQQSHQEMIMTYCGYWESLRGKPETSNPKKITVHIPQTNILTVNALQSIMQRISAGGLP